MDFRYTENYDDYRDVLCVRAVDCICKNVCNLESDKAKRVYELGRKVGYDQVIWGYRCGLWGRYDVNRIVQLGQIQRVISKGIKRPVRIIIGYQGTIWIDNLHTCIASILCYGENMKISDMPVYIVDMRDDVPIIVDINRSVSFDYDKIAGVIQCSKDRLSRIHIDLYDVNYTICEFMTENKISRDRLTLDESFYEMYKQL